MTFRAFDPAALVNTFTLFILVALTEEFMCRTYLLSSLMDSMNKYWAVFIVALFFGIMHLLNPNFTWIGFVDIMLAGLFLGLWYIFRKNIWFPVGFHLTWNYFQGSVYGFEVSGMKFAGKLFQIKQKADAMLTGGSFGIEGSVVSLVVLAAGCYLLDSYLRRKTAYES